MFKTWFSHLKFTAFLGGRWGWFPMESTEGIKRNLMNTVKVRILNE
jgi:hypothetical protein